MGLVLRNMCLGKRNAFMDTLVSWCLIVSYMLAGAPSGGKVNTGSLKICLEVNIMLICNAAEL